MRMCYQRKQTESQPPMRRLAAIRSRISNFDVAVPLACPTVCPFLVAEEAEVVPEEPPDPEVLPAEEAEVPEQAPDSVKDVSEICQCRVVGIKMPASSSRTSTLSTLNTLNAANTSHTRNAQNTPPPPKKKKNLRCPKYLQWPEYPRNPRRGTRPEEAVLLPLVEPPEPISPQSAGLEQSEGSPSKAIEKRV